MAVKTVYEILPQAIFRVVDGSSSNFDCTLSLFVELHNIPGGKLFNVATVAVLPEVEQNHGNMLQENCRDFNSTYPLYNRCSRR